MPQPFRYHVVRCFAIALGATMLAAPAASAQTMGSPERYRAVAMNLNNARASAGNIDITVDRWSTDKQRDALMAVMLEKGPDKLLEALQDTPAVGHFGVPGELSWDIAFARKTPLPDGGERVVLITAGRSCTACRIPLTECQIARFRRSAGAESGSELSIVSENLGELALQPRQARERRIHFVERNPVGHRGVRRVVRLRS